MCESFIPKDKPVVGEETEFPTCTGTQFGYEKKEYDISFVHAPNGITLWIINLISQGINVYKVLRDGLASRNISIGNTQQFENSDHDYSQRTEQERIIAQYVKIN